MLRLKSFIALVVPFSSSAVCMSCIHEISCHLFFLFLMRLFPNPSIHPSRHSVFKYSLDWRGPSDIVQIVVGRMDVWMDVLVFVILLMKKLLWYYWVQSNESIRFDSTRFYIIPMHSEYEMNYCQTHFHFQNFILPSQFWRNFQKFLSMYMKVPYKVPSW